MVVLNSIWEGDRNKIGKFDPEHVLVQIGWWYEPEQQFVPVTEEQPQITGSASPVYCEDGD